MKMVKWQIKNAKIGEKTISDLPFTIFSLYTYDVFQKRCNRCNEWRKAITISKLLRYTCKKSGVTQV
jgi:hypothetical protein